MKAHAFSEKNHIFQREIKINSEHQKIEFKFKKGMEVAFWGDLATKRQRMWPFPRKIIFFEREIKINSDVKKIELWFKKAMYVAFLA